MTRDVHVGAVGRVVSGGFGEDHGCPAGVSEQAHTAALLATCMDTIISSHAESRRAWGSSATRRST